MPHAPSSPSGYSGTPLPKKLGIKPGSTVALLGAPGDFETTLGALPDNVRLVRRARGTARTILLFVRFSADLPKLWDKSASMLGEEGALWIVWPKKTSTLASDVGENEIRAFGLARGFVDYKVCAVDATWSALAFARRSRNGAR